MDGKILSKIDQPSFSQNTIYIF